jgi:lipopolysaccharide transport system permease protein
MPLPATEPTPPPLADITMPETPEPDEFILINSRGARSSAYLGDLRELWAHRSIAGSLVLRQLRLRYKGSFVGIFWSMVPPLVQVFVLTIVVGYILSSGPHNQSAYIFCAFLPWIFVNTALLDASSSVLEQGFLLKKAYFPREILPIASVLANFIHFCIAVCVFLVYRYGITTLLFGWPGLPPKEIVWFPVVVLDLLMLTLGISMILSAWTTFFEDVKYVVSTGLSLLFYALPIMYFSEQIAYSTRARHAYVIYLIYLANPLAWIVTAFKQMFFSVQIIGVRDGVTLYSAPFDYRYFIWTTVLSFAVLVFGYGTFSRLKWKFAERP